MFLPSPAGAAPVITEFSEGITPAANLTGITAGPDGNLWFAEASAAQIGRITPDGVVTEFSVGITPGAFPVGITAGPDGNLWFTERELDQIGRITPAGVVTEFGAGITANSNPTGITAGPDGNLWFTESTNDTIGRITPAGVVTEFSAGITAGASPTDITEGPDGNLWFTESGLNQVARITPAGAVTEFGGPTGPQVSPYAITTGPDGNLWYVEGSGQHIGRMTTDGVATEFFSENSLLNDITSGPDGNLWFTDGFSEGGGNQIGRITPGGTITTYPDGITGSNPFGITTGPDDNLWFTERNSDQIGRLVPEVIDPPDPPEPVAGKKIVVKTISGTVLVKVPGSNKFVPLDEITSIPVGSIIDTKKGVVRLTSATGESTQSARFKFGRFKVTQSGKRGAFTVLQLWGPLLNCRKPSLRSIEPRSFGFLATTSRSGSGGRKLWGSGKGKFTSKGKRGSGSARGTTWQVWDRCNSTTEIKSIQGRVVARDFATKRKVVLKTGKKYIARPSRGQATR